MKSLSPVFLLATTAILPLLTSCADPTVAEAQATPQKVPIESVATAGTTIPEDSLDKVRSPEVVKAYPHGRYKDPNNPDVMYSAGTTYRKEVDSSWNLNPEGAAYLPAGPAPAVSDPNKAPDPLTVEMQQQLETQKKYTATIIEQNEAMGKRLEVLNQQSEQFKSVLDQNQALVTKNNQYEERIAQLKSTIDKLTAVPTPEPTWWDKCKSLLHLHKFPDKKPALPPVSS